MPKLCDSALCSGCAACANICPKGCITMKPDSEGFLRPQVDEESCVNCGLCEKICPILHAPALPEFEPELWAAINESDSDRLAAASGGMFILLARQIVAQGGVVFGAAFQKDFSIAHEAAETEDEVFRFCGPKYAQSVIGNTFSQAKTLLEQGTPVLFSGTPCQISGLRSFLKKDYPNLLTVDIICHGVPSPEVWKKYVAQRSMPTAPNRITFRSKEQSWTRYEVVFTYDEGEYRVPNRKDPYMRGFLKELYLRPSCYQCAAKGTRRASDITLGDLWGCAELCPELFDDKGTSLVLLHSEKGRKTWNAIQAQLRCMPVGMKALEYNPAAIRSVVAHPAREKFFQRFPDCENLSALIMELTPDPTVKSPSFYQRVRGKLGRILRSLKQ